MAGSLVPVSRAEAAAAPLPTVHYANVNNVTLGYREYGVGEPLILICGFGATMDQWNSTFISLLAAQFHVYTFDNRGMGYSTTDDETPAISQYSNDTAALIHYLGYSSMYTYGTSMGSTISQQLVIDHPEVIRKMVMSSATYDVYIPECSLLLSILQQYAGNTSTPIGLRNEALANLAWPGSYDQLANVNKSAMLIVGTADLLTPDVVSWNISGQINGSWLVRLKNIPHSGQSYAPVEYAANVINFLQTSQTPVYPWPMVPTAPLYVQAVPGDGKITLTWQAPATNGGSAITSYMVLRSTSPNGTYLVAGTSASMSFVDTGLVNGHNYWYKVSAINSVGSGNITYTSGATPQAPASVDNTMLYVVSAIAIIAVIALVVVLLRKK